MINHKVENGWHSRGLWGNKGKIFKRKWEGKHVKAQRGWFGSIKVVWYTIGWLGSVRREELHHFVGDKSNVIIGLTGARCTQPTSAWVSTRKWEGSTTCGARVPNQVPTHTPRTSEGATTDWCIRLGSPITAAMYPFGPSKNILIFFRIFYLPVKIHNK